MVQPINKDPLILAAKSADSTPDDIQTAQNLLDTLKAHKDSCVGMAADMIGVNKRIIAFCDGNEYCVMFNPRILKCSSAYETEEGCLSLSGTRKAKRWKSIKVAWSDNQFRPRIKTFSGFTAQIIQHEIDHCNGIII